MVDLASLPAEVRALIEAQAVTIANQGTSKRSDLAVAICYALTRWAALTRYIAARKVWSP